MNKSRHARAGRLLASLASGILFGLGLAISQMTNPAKVIGFLDITGSWDPTLAVVLGAALMVSVPAFRLILKRPHPLFATSFSLPTRDDLDPRLIGGAALFGVGWGLGGFCPGPGVAAMVTMAMPVILFAFAMLAGAFVYDRIKTL